MLLISITMLTWLLPLLFLAMGCFNVIMRKGKSATPMLAPLAACITGIITQSQIFLPLFVLFPVTILATLVLHYAHTVPMGTKTYTALLFFFAGALIYEFNTQHYELTFARIKNKEIAATGVITDKNDWINDWKKGEALYITTSSFYDRQQKTTTAFSCNLLCYLHRKTSLHIGDTISLKNITLIEKKQNSTSGNPTYNDYPKKQKIMGSLFIKRSDIKLLSRPDWCLWRWLYNARLNLYRKITKKLSPHTSSFFGLIFLGNRNIDNQDTLKKIFNFWGLDHYLARSGLHIVLFIVIWSFLLQMIPLHLTAKRIFLICLCLIYSMLSWSSLSFVRALSIFLCSKFGELLFLPTNFLHLLSLCCLIMLLFNPMVLFFLDFQLTFGLTFTLALLTRIMRA